MPLIDDEAMLELVLMIETTSTRYRKHIGQTLELTVLSAHRYDGQASNGSSFFGSVTLRGAQRSALAYLPSEPFWSLPQLVSGGARWVQLQFTPLGHGHGTLIGLYFGHEPYEGERITG